MRAATVLYLPLLACGALAAMPVSADEDGLGFYASLRSQAESVHANQPAYMDSYNAFRDAYSRVGIKAEHVLAGGMHLFAQVEVPFDSANLTFRDPYDQGGSGRSDGQSLRLGLAGISGDAGKLMLGQQWLPYYNAIAAPVDMFSSYYSGFATYTVFRVADTVAYYSPTMHGFSLAASYSGANGNQRSTSRIDARRVQFTASYAIDDTLFSAGVDDRGDAGYGRNRIYGAALSHQAGPLYVAAKYEVFDTGNQAPGSFSSDGNRAVNLFASYVVGQNTVKLMLADVERYGGNVLHLGFDHQYNTALKIFAEFYREDETAAVTVKQGGLSDYDGRIEGGRVLLIGVRYDF